MGLRGPQPVLQLKSEPLADLQPPRWLQGEGVDFWNRHAKMLAENQLLTETTKDAFANLCHVSHMLAGYRQDLLPTKTYFDLIKTWERLAKAFRLLPTEKPNVKEPDRFKDFPEVEIA